MSDTLPSKERVQRFDMECPDCDAYQVEKPEGRWVRYEDFAVVHDSHKWLYQERERLQAGVLMLENVNAQLGEQLQTVQREYTSYWEWAQEKIERATAEPPVSEKLPPLPKVDGYDRRVEGHYSATSMLEYGAMCAINERRNRASQPATREQAMAWLDGYYINRLQNSHTGDCPELVKNSQELILSAILRPAPPPPAGLWGDGTREMLIELRDWLRSKMPCNAGDCCSELRGWIEKVDQNITRHSPAATPPQGAQHCEMEQDGESHDLTAGVVCVACYNRAARPPEEVQHEAHEIANMTATEELRARKPLDIALGRLSMAMGNPAVQWNAQNSTLESALVDEATQRLLERPAQPPAVDHRDGVIDAARLLLVAMSPIDWTYVFNAPGNRPESAKTINAAVRDLESAIEAWRATATKRSDAP